MAPLCLALMSPLIGYFVREVELLEAHFCHQVSVLHCSFLTWEQSSHNLLDSCGLLDPSFSLGIYAW